MTPEELAEIEARAEAATLSQFDLLHPASSATKTKQANAAELVRKDMPALIAEVRRREEGAVRVGKMVARLNAEMNELQAENEKLRAALQIASEHLRQLSSGLGMGDTEGAEELARKGASFISDTLDEIEEGRK